MNEEVKLMKMLLFKEKVKKWHDMRILKREFHVGEKVLLYRLMRHGVDVNHRPVGNPKWKV
jgi:hypothetical protein